MDAESGNIIVKIDPGYYRPTEVHALLGDPSKAKKELLEAIEKTKDNTRMTLILALSYSGRWEIVNAVNKIIHDSKNNLAIDLYIPR